jgi:hypothetical protein
MDTTNPLSITMPEPLGPREHFPKVTAVKTPKDSKDAQALGSLIVAPADLTGKGFTPIIQTAQQEGVVAEKRYQEQEDTQFMDVVKAKFINDTFLGTLGRRAVAERFADKVDPNHRVDPKDLAGFTESEQKWLNASVNKDDFEARKFDLMDYRDQAEIGDRLGPWVGFAAGMMAGLPEGVASGNLVARGFAGLKAANTLGMNLTEQVVGNVGLVALQSAFDTHVSSEDYAMALALSGISSIMGSHGSHPDGAVLKEVDRLQKVADTSAEEHMNTLKKAADNLGDGATTEQIKVEADRLEANTVKTITHTGELPEDRHILPLDDTAIRTDVKDEVKPGAEAGTEGPSGPMEPPKLAEGTDTPPAETTSATGPMLPKELSGAKPRWKTYDIEFASDIDKALFIVSQKSKSKADAQYRDWLKSQGLTDADIEKYSKVIRDNLKAAEKGTIPTKVEPPPVKTEPEIVRNQKAAETITKIDNADWATLGTTLTPEGKLNAGKTVQPILQEIAAKGDTFTKALANRILTALGDTAVNYAVFSKAAIRKLTSNVIDRSAYYPSLHTIVVDPSDHRGRLKNTQWVILHEAAHAATVYKLNYGLNNPTTELGKLAVEIDRIRMRAERHMITLPDDHPYKKDTTVSYYLTNPKEFVAGLFSQDEGVTFRHMLSELKVEGKPLITKFVTLVKQLLGIGDKEDNAFLRALGLTDKLMDTKADVMFRDDKVAHMAPVYERDAQDNGLKSDAPVDEFTNVSGARAAFEKGGMSTQETSGMRELYAQQGIKEGRLQQLDKSPEWQAMLKKLTGGEYSNSASIPTDGPRIRLTKIAADSGMLPAVVKAYESLMHLLPKDNRIILTIGANGTENGSIMSLGNTHIIALNVDKGRRGVEVLRTAAHEFGHAVYHAHAQNIPPEMRAKMTAAYLNFLRNAGKPVNSGIALMQRVSPTNSMSSRMSLSRSAYNLSRDEFTAEQFVKWMERENAKGSKEHFTLPERMVQVWNDLVNSMLSAYNEFKQKKLVTPEESFADFFQYAAKKGMMEEPVPSPQSQRATSVAMNSPTALAHGLHLLPIDTPSKQAEVQAMVHMYEKADRLAPQVDETRLSKLMNTALFSGGQAAANTMLRSANTLVRWVASELLESPGGAGGRRSTAAIAKHIAERRMMGNTLNEVQAQYETFRKAQGISAVDDYWGGKTWQRFNRMVAEEIEGRKAGAMPAESPAEVIEAANSIEKAFDRIRKDQVEAKSVGWASLPDTSVGYMPHRMSPEKVINMTMAQKEALHSALTDQFITIEGWDASFADALASKYLNQVERRALGGFDAPVGVHQTGAADIVEEALQAMGMDREQVTLTMKKFMQAGPGYTKRRIRLDLNQSHNLADGTEFKLMDLFDTDMFSLIRAQAGRASGEVALARHGIMGKAHLRLIREAMMQGDNKSRATARELQAFDQVAAEFLNEPFGTQNKWVDRIMQFNSLARLGGMGFTQAAESINGMVSVGIARTFASIGSMGRMRNEILTLAKGEAVNNPILSSIEKFSGAEFGTDAYKIVFPFDNGSLQYQTYGSDSLTHADRLLRGGAHAQGKPSFWRAFHSTQQRGFAEQIVRKAFEYVRAGTNDVALRDMGITEELAMNLRAEMGSIATFNGDKLASLDITKMENTAAANEFVQAIHRGTSQIIQDTFIGEKGVWAHEGMARLMTQFRTFSLTSIEKQWARQRGNVGTAKSLGIIMAAMAAATPLYMARTYVQSIGRKDQQAYLENRLSFYNLARATMNYVAATGLAGDFMDAGQAITGADFMGNERGNTGGAGAKRFIGNMVAPALGTADDVWKAVQNTKKGTDPTELVKVLPGSRLPYLMPAINALGN